MNAIIPYDSTEDTVKHIENVRTKIMKVIADLIQRGFHHDRTKLEAPEKEHYDKYTPMLKGLEYGSSAYREVLRKMQVGIDHHYSHNRHHPEFFADGINGMNLIDVIEMLLDWKSASERHATGDIFKSIDINVGRFKIDPQLAQILKNTATYLWYE